MGIKTKNAQNVRSAPRWCVYFLMVVVISFGGWCFEVAGRFLVYRVLSDRGFLTLPLCPIYGTTLLLMFLIMGTPHAPAGLGKYLLLGSGKRGFGGRIAAYGIYFAAATVIPTLAELAVGGAFGLMGVRLWDYSGMPFNLFGVICLHFSLLWGVLITLFMSLAWGGLYKAMARLPQRFLVATSFSAALLILADFTVTAVGTWA